MAGSPNIYDAKTQVDGIDVRLSSLDGPGCASVRRPWNATLIGGRAILSDRQPRTARKRSHRLRRTAVALKHAELGIFEESAWSARMIKVRADCMSRGPLQIVQTVAVPCRACHGRTAIPSTVLGEQSIGDVECGETSDRRSEVARARRRLVADEGHVLNGSAIAGEINRASKTLFSNVVHKGVIREIERRTVGEYRAAAIGLIA
jgi:hypothetical protein